MQVNATLIAAQQAAREAQARFQSAHVAPKPATAQAPQASFAAALDDDLFKPLPLKQTSAPQAAPAMANAPAPANSRPGSLLDIKI